MSGKQKQDSNPGGLSPIHGFFFCSTLLIYMPLTLQMIGILLKVNTILNSCFNMFPIMDFLLLVEFVLCFELILCELFTSPPVSMTDIANQSHTPPTLSPEVAPDSHHSDPGSHFQLTGDSP